jgi:hypothetical protein
MASKVESKYYVKSKSKLYKKFTENIVDLNDDAKIFVATFKLL